MRLRGVCVLAVCVLVIPVVSSRIEAACVDPSTVAPSTVSITRDFDAQERAAEPGVIGIRGTGWFLSPRLVVTAAHVAEAMHLSSQAWKEIGIRETENSASIAVRILHVAGSQAEKIAVVELMTAFPGALALRSRMEPLIPDERVVSLGYPAGQLRFAGGRFVRYGDAGAFNGAALLELHDGNDRLVLDHGASGAPVLECDGRVVAVVATLITQTVSFLSGVIRTSTAWQTPNVVSIPIQGLKDFVRPE